MSAMASQITSLTIVYSTVYSGTDQRKHQNSASLVFVRGIHRWPVNSPHKGPVTRKMFPFDNVIMSFWYPNENLIHLYKSYLLKVYNPVSLNFSKRDLYDWSRFTIGYQMTRYRTPFDHFLLIFWRHLTVLKRHHTVLTSGSKPQFKQRLTFPPQHGEQQSPKDISNLRSRSGWPRRQPDPRKASLIARFMGPTWGPSGTDRTQVGPSWPHELCYLG